MIRTLLFISLVFLSLGSFGQNELFMAEEFQNAYEKNTRDKSGAPGENYWQNSISYSIDAEIIPGTWEIIGSQEIEYTNNSPDTLRSIVINTYPNLYKRGGPRATAVPLENVTEGIEISDFRINDTSIDLSQRTSAQIRNTFFVVRFPEPMLPGETATLSMQWETALPLIYTNRIGAYDEESAFMGYWYPQIARYDDIDGWDVIEYLGIQEFHSDFADFDVDLTAPSGFKIWATGVLQNPEEVLSEDEYNLYEQAQQGGQPVTISSAMQSSAENTNKSTWEFKAEMAKDFAAGISKNFEWISQTIETGDKTVSSNFVYDAEEYENLGHLLQIQNEGLVYFRNEYPGVTYPFPGYTTFIGVAEFDGMEFPMMANNGVSDSETDNTDVTIHELAHMYFPFYVGINEVKYSWMEEGWAIFLTIKFMQDYYAGTENENVELTRNLNSYNSVAGRMWDVPLITPSYLLTYTPAHVILAYRKPAFLYLTLENILGEELFKTGLTEYVNRWAEKHPTPYDFMFTFNDVSERDLNWFWKAWVFEPGYPDLALNELEESSVLVENVGGLPLPVNLKLTYEDGSETIIERKADEWSTGNKTLSIDIGDATNLTTIEIMADVFPDADQTNNMLEITSSP